MIHPNLKLMSHSSDGSLTTCDRKYQIYKLRPSFGNLEFEDGDFHLDFGTIVGSGVQEWLKEHNLNDAYWKMFLQWNRHLEDEEGLSKKKTFWHGLMALDKFIRFSQEEYRNYELVSFNGKPAVELGFSIDCGDGYYYRGRLDGVLFDKVHSSLIPLEVKTTGNWVVSEAMYKNQGQAAGYKLILDAISKLLDIPIVNKYKVEYTIYQTHQQEWHRMPFMKSNETLVRWIKTLLVNKQRIEFNGENNYWPMNGNSCFNMGRNCKYFGSCEMNDAMLFEGRIEEKDVEKDKDSYEFQFKLSELIKMVTT